MPIYSPEKSKIKMVILLKNGNLQDKIIGNNGKLYNPVWYSIITKNYENDKKIISNMVRRFKKTTLYEKTNVLQFYKNGKLIDSIRL